MTYSTQLTIPSPEGDFFIRPMTLRDASNYYDTFDATRANIALHDPDLANVFMTISEVQLSLASFATIHHPKFAIIKKDEIIGATALRKHTDRSQELSYWVNEAHQGKGIASRAGAMTVDIAFRYFYAPYVEARILDTNLASRRTAEKIGFEYSHHFSPEEVVYRLNSPD